MPLRFVEPLITADEDARVLRLRAAPEVFTTFALPPEASRRIASLVLAAHAQGQSWESRTRYAPESPAAWDVNRKFRSSRNISPRLPGLEEAYDAMAAACAPVLSSFGFVSGAVRLEPVEDQCLVYLPGDHIGDHADDAAGYLDDQGKAAWHVIKPQRHLVSVMWLTTQTAQGSGEYEFAGGGLRFNSLIDEASGEAFTLMPLAGLMAMFPASAWFRHEVLPVTAGIRLALTRWWQVVADHDNA